MDFLNIANEMLNEMDGDQLLTEATALRTEVERLAKRMNMTKDQVAYRVGSDFGNWSYSEKDLDKVLDKKTPMSKDVAWGLQKTFGIHYSHWVDLAKKP